MSHASLRSSAVVLALLTGMVSLVAHRARAAEEPPAVSFDLQGTEAAEAFAQIAAQTHWDIYVGGDVTGKITLKADKFDGEKALNTMADQCGAGWLRFYLVEKPADQRPSRTVDKLLELLGNRQRERLQKMPEDRRRELLQRGFDQGVGARGGGAAQQGQGAAATPGGQVPNKFVIDPLRFLRAAEFRDKVSGSLQQVDLPTALLELWNASGYPIVTEETDDKPVSINATDEDLEKVLEQVCQTLDLRWHRAYLVTKPQEMTREQMAQRMEQGWNQTWDMFWKQDPATRQQWLQTGISMIKNIPPDRLEQIRKAEWAPRIVERFTNFMTNITPEQRQEIAPLVRELMNAFAPGN